MAAIFKRFIESLKIFLTKEILRQSSSIPNNVIPIKKPRSLNTNVYFEKKYGEPGHNYMLIL